MAIRIDSASTDGTSEPDPAGDGAVLAVHPERIRREAAAIAAVAAAVYLAALSSVPALTHDSLGYLLAIEHGGAALFHPHHLAYNAVSRAWLDLWSLFGLDSDPLRIVESLNALLGATAAALVWVILRARARLPRVSAGVGTAGAALSYGVWYYSVSVEVYVLSLVLLLATFLVLTSEHHTSRRAAAIGGVLGLAVLAHQVNVLFGLVVVVEIVRRAERGTAGRRLAVAGAAAGAVLAAAYGAVLAFVVRPHSIDAASNWFTSYAQVEGYWHVDPSAPRDSSLGLARALVGGQFAYRLDAVRGWAEELFPSKSLVDESFLVRDQSPGLAGALIGITVAGAVLLAGTLVVGLWRRRDVPEPARTLLRPLALWLAVYSTFFIVWEPYNPEFHIPQVTAWWMVAAVVITRRCGAAVDGRAKGTRVGLAGLAGAALCVAIANGLGTVLPATDARNDAYALRYRTVAEEVGEGDLLIVDHPHLGLGYATRETEATPLAVTNYTIDVTADPPAAPSPRQISDLAERALERGQRVAVDAYLVNQPSNGVAGRAGAELAARFGDRWRPVVIFGTRGWYVIDPA